MSSTFNNLPKFCIYLIFLNYHFDFCDYIHLIYHLLSIILSRAQQIISHWKNPSRHLFLVTKILLKHSHTHSFCTFSLADFIPQWQSWIPATKIMGPTEPKVFTIRPFAAKVCCLLSIAWYTASVEYIYLYLN